MIGTIRSWLMPIIAVALAAAARYALDPWVGENVPYGLFFLAVAVTALYSGFGPAVLSVLLSALTVDYLFFHPRYTLWGHSAEEWGGMALFCMAAFAVSFLGYVSQRARAIAESKAQEYAGLVGRLRRQAALIDLSPDAILVLQRDGTIKLWSKGAEKLYGWTKDEAIGRNAHTLLQTHFPEPLPHIIDQLQRGRDWTGELIHKTQSGREVTVLSSWSAERINDAFEILETNVDISARKRAEEALRESELSVRRKLESVLSPLGDVGMLELADLIDIPALQKLVDDFYALAHVPVSILDVKGRVLVGAGWQDVCLQFHRVQPDACRHCLESDTVLSAGLAQGQYRLYKCKNNMWDMATPIFVAGKHVGNVFTGQFFFDDEAIDRELFRAQARQFGFDEQQYLAALERAPRLTRQMVERGISFFLKLAEMLSQLGYRNVELARLLAERDRLTESLSESELFHRQTLESIPGMVFTTRPDGYCDYQSQQWVDYTGVPMSEHLGDGWNALLHPDDRPRAFAAWRAAVEGTAPYDLEYRVRRRDGVYEWFRVIGRPIRGAGGEIVRWFGVALNIEHLKAAEADLQAARISAEQAKAAAERANAAKDQFLAVLSHELRTPLAPVLAGITLLKRRCGDGGDVSAQLEILERNIQLEARLIDDLLDLTRIERGKISLDRKLVNIRTVLERVAEICRPEVSRRQLQFVMIEGPALLVNGDIARLQQIFWNLLNNAIKFTPDHGSISMEGGGIDGRAVVEVIDSGIGIEPDVLPRIFSAFEQGDTRVTRQFGGLGLGLAITKRLVEMHGGTITAESAGMNKGTKLRVMLPLADSQETQADVSAETVRVPQVPVPRCILLVEDHADTALMMKELLQLSGYEVETAADVEQGLERVARRNYDLVISDLGLPGRSGLELMEELRRREKPIKGIALSGFGREEDVRRSKEAGFAEHLTKPVDFDALVAAVEKVMSAG